MTGSLADEGLRAWVRDLRAAPSSGALDVADLRAAGRERGLRRPREPAVGAVRDSLVGGVGTRRYRVGSGGPVATVVFVHGGFWCVGDLETHDRLCRRIAVAAGVDVVAVDQRRAPEHPWPAAVEDVVAVVGAVDGPVVLAGDSSGGHVATLAAIALRDAGGRVPAGLALACPNADPALAQPSVAALGSGWGLDADALRWAVARFLPDGVAPDDPRVSPLHAPLHDLPPTAIVTADHDPLRDEGQALAARLRAAGTPVTERREAGMVHGFVQNLDAVSAAAGAATDRWLADVRQLVERA